MSHSINFSFRGLYVEAEISQYHPGVHTLSNGDPGYPPEGGECESYTWEVEDLDTVLEALELDERWETQARVWYRLVGQLPQWTTDKIEHEWASDIRTEAEEQDE